MKALGEMPASPPLAGFLRALRSLALFPLPFVAAVLAGRYLVPAEGSGVAGFLATIGSRAPIPFGVGLFLLLSAIAGYWLRRPSGEGGLAARQPAPRSRQAQFARFLLVVGGAASAALLFRTFVARPYRVEGASMLPTLEPGDLVVGTTLPGRTLRRGDVLVFRQRVKRVIGLPGDRIGMREATPVINGWTVPSCDAGDYLYIPSDDAQAVHGRVRVEFLDGRTYLTVAAPAKPFPQTYVVKPGEVFVLGDDRGNSTDSRAYGGGVPLDAVEARVDRFLSGAHRGGDADLGRLLRSIDALQIRPRLEGVDTKALEEGVRRCLETAPAVTHPPTR